MIAQGAQECPPICQLNTRMITSNCGSNVEQVLRVLDPEWKRVHYCKTVHILQAMENRCAKQDSSTMQPLRICILDHERVRIRSRVGSKKLETRIPRGLVNVLEFLHLLH
eukprot:3327524-Amphidinium_carterae.1